MYSTQTTVDGKDSVGRGALNPEAHPFLIAREYIQILLRNERMAKVEADGRFRSSAQEPRTAVGTLMCHRVTTHGYVTGRPIPADRQRTDRYRDVRLFRSVLRDGRLPGCAGDETALRTETIANR